MTCNAEARLVEAKDRGWLGEVAALEESVTHLRPRQTEAQAQLHTSGEASPVGGTHDTVGPLDRADERVGW